MESTQGQEKVTIIGVGEVSGFPERKISYLAEFNKVSTNKSLFLHPNGVASVEEVDGEVTLIVMDNGKEFEVTGGIAAVLEQLELHF